MVWRILIILLCALSVNANAQRIEEMEELDKQAAMLLVKVNNLTCPEDKQKKIKCTFNHETAAPFHARIHAVREALKSSLTLGTGGIVQCMGKLRERAGCIADVRILIGEIDKALRMVK